MSNPSKAKGTRQETRICNVINDFAGAKVAERVVLHGSSDHGDLRITLGPLVLTGESKCSSKYPSEGKLLDYKSQTLIENENAGQDGGLLFVNVPGRSINRMEVWLQRSTHYRMEMARVGMSYPDDVPPEFRQRVDEIMCDSEFSWRRITLTDFLHEYFGRPAWEDK